MHPFSNQGRNSSVLFATRNVLMAFSHGGRVDDGPALKMVEGGFGDMDSKMILE